MKDSTETKLDLPEGWEATGLGDVASQRKESVSPNGDGKTKYVGLEHIVPADVSLTRWGYDNEIRSGKFRFYTGDILYGKLRPYLDKCCLSSIDGICSTDIIVIQASEDVFDKYLVFLLHYKSFVEYAISTMTGVNHPRTSWSALRKYELPLPPLPEQKKIAAVLSTIHDAKEKTENVIAALKEMKKSMMKHLFTYGAVPIADVDKVRLKETEIGVLPEMWEVSRLGELPVSIQTGPFGSQLHASDYIKGGIPVINPANISEGKILPDINCSISLEKAHSLSRHLMKQGDIVFGRRGEMGRSAIVKDDGLFCGTGSLLVRFEDCNIDAEYISYFFRTEPVKEWLLAESIGTTMKNLNTEILGRMRIPLPSIKEQVMIKSTLSAIEKNISSEENKWNSLDALFRTLLSLLMTGKVRVNNLEL